MIFLASLLLAVAAPATPPVAALSPPSPAREDYARRQAASLRLAQLLYPAELQAAVGRKALRGQFVPTLMKDPGIQELESTYPGVLEAVVAELEPVFVKWILGEMPSYHKAIADLYATEFTLTEIEEITAFFSTPTGRKLSQGVQINQSFEGVLAEAIRDPDSPTTTQVIDADKRASIAETLKMFDATDVPELLRLSRAPWFSKLNAFGAKVTRFEADYMNRPAPQFEADIERVMNETLKRFEARAKHKTTT